jgi:hypothetical protein
MSDTIFQSFAQHNMKEIWTPQLDSSLPDITSRRSVLRLDAVVSFGRRAMLVKREIRRYA